LEIVHLVSKSTPCVCERGGNTFKTGSSPQTAEKGAEKNKKGRKKGQRGKGGPVGHDGLGTTAMVNTGRHPEKEKQDRR